MTEHSPDTPSVLDTLWYTRCPVPTGLGIAVQKGWLESSLAARGTAVKSLRESNDRAVRESHFDHTLRNSVRHGGSIPAIWARAEGRDTRLLGLSWADEVQLILTRSDSGIRTPRDLKGRRFGLPKWQNVQIDFVRAQALRGLENALKLDGLSVSDVELVDHVIDKGYSDEPARRVGSTLLFNGSGRGGRNIELVSLLRGDVDAIFLKGAHAAHYAQAFGLTTVIDTGSHPEPLIRANNGTPRTLTVDGNLVDRHPDVVATLLGEVLRAERWAQENPDETRRFLANETNSAEYWVTRAYGEDAHQRLRTDLDDTAIAGIQDFTDFLARWNFIPQRFEIRDWIDGRALEQARAQLQAEPVARRQAA